MRLGCGPRGAAEIREHAFFAGVDWEAMQQRRVPPVFTAVTNVLETRKVVRCLPGCLGQSLTQQDALALPCRSALGTPVTAPGSMPWC